MIDMGGGSLWRFEQSGARIEDLQAILFTHFHVDHSADFPVLVKSAFFTDRQDELPIYGPNDTGKTGYLVNTTTFVKRLFSKTEGVYPYLSSYFDPSSDSRYHFTAHNVPIDNDKPMQIKKTEEYKLSSVPVNHGFLPAIAWRFDIKTKNGYKSITVSGDMNGERGTLEQLAKNTDLLIAHTAIHQHTQGAGAFLHMKPKTIGAIAKKAQAKSLLLSHFMKRSLNRQTEITEQISENYKGPINFATDLSCWKVD